MADRRERGRVLVVDPIEARAAARLADAVEVVRPNARSARALRAAIADVDGAIVRTTPLGHEVLASAEHLQVVAKHGVGVDAIDVAAATRLGIVVTNTPAANAPAVAEFALTAILLLLKPMLAGEAWLRDRAKSGEALVAQAERAGLVGHELTSQTVGILGWGAIGRRVGHLVGALGGRVAAYDAAVTPRGSAGARVRAAPSLDDLLESANVLSIHVPLSDATAGLIGAAELARMPPGSALVNTARGGVVDEHALADAIRRGHLRGAVVDVFAQEPPPSDHPLLGLDSVVCTPHIAATTSDALARMADAAVDAVLAVLAGRLPSAVVNAEVLDQLRLRGAPTTEAGRR